MPRPARMYVVGLSYRLVQRGNTREACFIEPENDQLYLEPWRDRMNTAGRVMAAILGMMPAGCVRTRNASAWAARRMHVATLTELFKHQLSAADLHLTARGHTIASRWEMIGFSYSSKHGMASGRVNCIEGGQE